MSNVVNTKYGDRGLVHLPPVQMGGSQSPAVNSIENAYRQWNPSQAPIATQPPVQAPAPQPNYPAPQPNYGGQWYGGAPAVSYASPTNAPQVYGPGNFVPALGQMNQLYQQASVPSMQSYYGQYPVLNAAPQNYQQYPQMPAMGPVGMQQPPPGQQNYQMPPYQQPYGQPGNGQEKHIFYGPDGQVLPGPPPGFALDGSKPRNLDQYPQDFAIEGVLDFGRLRAVELMDNTKRFPKIPEYLHRELLTKYKHYTQTHVRIVSRGGEIHVHATPYVDRVSPVVQPEVQYEYVPVYVDDNDQIVDAPYGEREPYRQREPYRERVVPYRSRYPFSPEIGRRYDRWRPYESDDDEPQPLGRYRVGEAPRTIVNAERVKPVHRPSTNY